jgi:hypothetical protein
MLEIVLTGLCVLSTATTSATLSCVQEARHAVRLNFPVGEENVVAWPKDQAGQELPAVQGQGDRATFEVGDKFELELVNPDQSEAYSPQASLADLLTRSDLTGQFKTSAPLSAVLTIDKGRLEAVDSMNRCFEVPSSSGFTQKQPLESAKWTRKAEGVKVRWMHQGLKVELILSAKKAVPLALTLSNDTGFVVGGPIPAGTEFDHWLAVTQLWDPKPPDRPKPCKANADRLELHTIRPICNILLDQ